MPEDAVTVPVKRGPGRPRKVAAPQVEVSPPADEWKTEPVKFPSDERIGESVGDVRVTGISFPDGTEYRCVAGIITERLR